jgi:hypothetical protein
MAWMFAHPLWVPRPLVARGNDQVAVLVRSAIMKVIRRALVALSLAGTIAGVLRLRGKGGVPPQAGGWREVSVPPK